MKHIYTYWQHVINSNQTTLLHSLINYNIEKDRTGEVNYYSRVKGLLLSLDAETFIFKESTKALIQSKAQIVQSNFQKMYRENFFSTLNEKAQRPESGGRFEVYSLVKKQYKFEQYLMLEKNYLRRNITNIRISTHNLPIESLRKANVKREERTCPLCSTKEIGSEFHAIINCQNQHIKQLRLKLNENINKLHNQWNKLSERQKFMYLTLAVDKQCTFYFAIFLDKVYKEYKIKL